MVVTLSLLFLFTHSIKGCSSLLPLDTFFIFMHFSKIYIQDNFVPNVVEDQFRRKVIGVEMTVNEGESMDEAKVEAEKYIKEYIQANTIYPDHNHIEEKIIPIQKTTAQSLEEQIENCQTIEDLDTWKMISKSNHKLGMAFAKRAAYLLSPDNNNVKKLNHDTKNKRNSKGN